MGCDQPVVPDEVLVPPVAILPDDVIGNPAVGGYCMVIVGKVVVSVPGLVNVTEVTLPNEPVPVDPASESSVPIVATAVAPLPPAIVITGAAAPPLP
jgi:hypothetical protein